MVVDITKRKQHEERLEQNIRLLEDRDRRKNEFLATLAHELRNPLATINLAIEFVETDLQEAVPNLEMDQAALKRALRQGRHLARLIEDLLQVSRIILGKIDLQKQIVDLQLLVLDALHLVRARAKEKGLQIFSDLGNEPLLVLGDPVRLTQALGNLLDNAVKFTEAPGTVEFLASRIGQEAKLVVRDTGLGMSPAQLACVFDLFWQAEQSAGGGVNGLGIGLALTQKLVQLHGGRIEAHSQGNGLGSEFTMYLPLNPSKCHPGTEESDLPLQSSTTRDESPA